MSSVRKPAPAPLRPPIRYAPALDPIGDDETEIAHDIADTMLKIARKTHADSGHAIRAVHAKSHGILKAELTVPDLPPILAQGVFAKPGRYPVVMRFSTIPGDILGDKVSTPRGVAIKIVGVEGERLEWSENAVTQDFIFVNGPKFLTKDPKAFLANLKLLAATTDKAEGAKKALSAVMRTAEKAANTVGGDLGALRGLGAEPPNHILGETFFNQLPVRYGEYIAKLQVAPVSPSLVALTGKPIDLNDGEDPIRAAVISYFRSNEAAWDIRVQLATDLDDTPIDDPTKLWDEEVAPFVTVGRITAPKQTAWSDARSKAVDDGMGFSPWHGIEDHRPLGEMMRLRKLAYRESQRFRSERNSRPVREPTNLDMLND